MKQTRKKIGFWRWFFKREKCAWLIVLSTTLGMVLIGWALESRGFAEVVIAILYAINFTVMWVHYLEEYKHSKK